MKLKTAPCLLVAMGMFVSPAFGKAIPNPVANSGVRGKKMPHMIHPCPVPNSRNFT